MVARPHQHVDSALRRGARLAAAARGRTRTEARKLAAQRRDALRRVLTVQVDQRLAVVGGLRRGQSSSGVGRVRVWTQVTVRVWSGMTFRTEVRKQSERHGQGHICKEHSGVVVGPVNKAYGATRSSWHAGTACRLAICCHCQQVHEASSCGDFMVRKIPVLRRFPWFLTSPDRPEALRPSQSSLT